MQQMTPQASAYWILSRTSLFLPFIFLCLNKKQKPTMPSAPRLAQPGEQYFRVTESWNLTTANWLRLLVKGLHKLCQVHDLPKTLCWVHIDELIQIMRACWSWDWWIIGWGFDPRAICPFHVAPIRCKVLQEYWCWYHSKIPEEIWLQDLVSAKCFSDIFVEICWEW